MHLSETGLHAGRRLCGAARDDGTQRTHAVYAPLHQPEFRKTVCTTCLEVWATEAYDPGDDMPDYIGEVRKKHASALQAVAL